MVKVKRARTIDCVVMGYRPGTAAGTVGSLILGLYEPGGALRPVGHMLRFPRPASASCAAELAPYETGDARQRRAEPLDSGQRTRVGRATSRARRRGRLRPVSDGRIRHGTKIVRWRDDKPPRECTIDQLTLTRRRSRWTQPPRYALLGRRAREGCTRGPSPAAWGSCGGQGASSRPLARVARGQLEQTVERARMRRRSSPTGRRGRAAAPGPCRAAAPPDRRDRAPPSRTGRTRARRGPRARE